ncbi:GntR family transcriptional regulator, partial [Actinomadura sp. KC06]|uniref:GntR family transcriptional regulator n=1 Tax=Actinomadura sp. KC06 TaxID=2530369 RepID=UPI001404A78E
MGVTRNQPRSSQVVEVATLGHEETFNSTSGQTGGSPQLLDVIRNAIVQAIIRGEYPRGARLPTNQQIQEHWQVSARTSRKVLAQLTDEGWAIAEGTRGYTSTGGPSNHAGRGTPVTIQDSTRPD